ncbi:MAG TPA: hypothetical protein VNG35_16510 [Gemmatimonadales bacterium]|nr:hypothetical protein [Gemmatimonadales bacterium]
MERIEHVEIRVGIAELKKLLGVPDGATIEPFATWADAHGNLQALQQQGRWAAVVSMSQCAPGTPISELRIRFTRDQEAAKP